MVKVGDNQASPLDVLVAELSAPDEASGEERDISEVGMGTVLRRLRLQAPDPEVDVGGDDTLVVDCWVPSPDHRALAKVTFSTTLTNLRDVMVDLFDALLVAARWQTPVDPDVEAGSDARHVWAESIRT